jgi:hypothetical protein
MRTFGRKSLQTKKDAPTGVAYERAFQHSFVIEKRDGVDQSCWVAGSDDNPHRCFAAAACHPADVAAVDCAAGANIFAEPSSRTVALASGRA